MLRSNQSFLQYMKQLHEGDKLQQITIKQYQKGQRLLTQGETVHKLMVIKEGIVKCFFEEANGKEFILEFLSTGEVLGEIEVIRNMKCLCNIEAVTEISVYTCLIPYFKDLLNSDLRLNHLLLEIFAERVVNTASRASYQQSYTVAHSLSKLLDLQASHGLEIAKEDMAAYLGVTLRSLNRTLKGMGV